MRARAIEKEYEERFWTKVDKENSDSFFNGSRCWEWTGYLLDNGYGRYWCNGKTIYAHRHSYLLKFGEFDTKLFVCRRCDNTKCVNPHHLFLGTNLENVQDRNKKGRQAHLIGEDNGRSKLDERQVIEVYKMYDSEKYTQTEIGKIFGVDASTIGYIIRGNSWSHLFKKLKRK